MAIFRFPSASDVELINDKSVAGGQTAEASVLRYSDVAVENLSQSEALYLTQVAQVSYDTDASVIVGTPLARNSNLESASTRSATPGGMDDVPVRNEEYVLDVSGVGQVIADSEDDSDGTPRVTVTARRTSAPKGPMTNPLNDYVNYTYGISLHAMDINKYNSVLVDGQEYTTNDNSVLIASGGRRHGEFSRHPRFIEDFYIENLKMNTVIGFNNRTRGSNVVDVNFTVVEPHGMTLLERLLSVASDYGIRAWDQMPLMLQIDFFANAENGTSNPPLHEHRKCICIKLVDCKIKVSQRGSEYNFTAVPLSHSAFMQNTVTTPAIFEVMAKTIGEFFDSSRSAGQAADIYGRVNEENPNESQAERRRLGFRTDVSKQTYLTYSYASAINSYQEQLAKPNPPDQPKQIFPDIYKFDIDEDIANSKIVEDPRINAVANVPMYNNKNRSVTVDATKSLTRINAGTTILDVINQVIKNSEYFTDLIKSDPSLLKMGNTPLTLFKIVPTVRINKNNWDRIRMQYQREITYHIKPYDYYNQKYFNSPRSLPSSWVKEYNYIYTGKNQEILDFNIDFNVMFFLAMTDNTAKFNELNVTTSDEDGNDIAQNTTSDSNQIQFLRYKNVVNQTDIATLQQSTESREAVKTNDLYKSIFSSSRGDMINVKLKITGDPHLIKQDDVFIPPTDSSGQAIVNRQNSINMDQAQIFAYLNFRTPNDIDQSIGMMDFGSAGKNVFSGRYQIVSVENIFDRGQFTQNLDLVRLFGQPEDAIKYNPQQSQERDDELVDYGDEYANELADSIQDRPTVENPSRQLQGDDNGVPVPITDDMRNDIQQSVVNTALAAIAAQDARDIEPDDILP